MDDRLIALDRTLRLLAEFVAATPAEIAAELERTVVAVRLAPGLAADANAQAAAVTLANLLVRSGLRVCPDIPEVVSRTPLVVGPLNGGLADLGEQVLPGAIGLVTTPLADVAVVVGASPAPSAQRSLWLVADRISGGFASRPGPFAPPDVLAAMEPASMAAAECIRFALRRLPPRTPTAAAWLQPIHDAHLGSPSVPLGPIAIGVVDAISAGAIVNAGLYAILARGEVTGCLRIFDGGRYELSNLNRYPLLGRRAALAQLAKADHLASFAPPGLLLEPVDHHFTPLDIAHAAPRIVVGADDIAVRHVAQDANPDWLGIGATGHDEVRITEHEPGEPCARCAHPHVGEPDDALIPTIAPVSFQAGLRLVSRLLRAAAGDPTPAALRYATYWPLRPGTVVLGPTPAHPSCPIHGRLAAA